MADAIPLDGQNLTPALFDAIVRGHRRVALRPEVRPRVQRGREAVERAVAAHRPIYGVTTGFGRLSDVVVPPERTQALQISLLRSHASGAGPPLPEEVVRGLLLLRYTSLARGHSGVRWEVVERLGEFLNRRLTPFVPEQGSVGASGDLAPLAHLGLPLVGEGAFLGPDGRPQPAADRLRSEGLAPLTLVEKEGVALVNGTSLMATYLALAVADLLQLEEAAIVASALSFDALRGDPQSLDDRLGALRNLPEQGAVAATLRALLHGSGLTQTGGEYHGQDPYTLRCLPQVFAAVRLAREFGERILVPELNAVTDNPVVFEGDEFVSGGNFHGQPLALALDTLALGVQYLTSFSERRTARLVNPSLNRGLPAFLAPEAGVSSGFMIPQYLAAALVNEGETLAHPASTASLSTSADQEDFVSMGPWAGAKLRRMMANARTVLAVEWIVAAQALELRRPHPGGHGSEAAWRVVRERVPTLAEDRSLSQDIARVAEGIADGTLVARVRAEVPF
jgi:histidine ammonia-lyase